MDILKTIHISSAVVLGCVAGYFVLLTLKDYSKSIMMECTPIVPIGEIFIMVLIFVFFISSAIIIYKENESVE
jgi:hypothetical protein